MEEKRYMLVSDNDGNDYIIAVDDIEDFDNWVDNVEEGVSINKDYYENRRVNTSGWTFTNPQGWR
jgi:hypothetical protein